MIGKHTYTTAGTYALTVTIDDMLTGKIYNVGASGSVVQGKISVQVHNLFVSAGKVFQGIVATFTDSGPDARTECLQGHDQLGQRPKIGRNHHRSRRPVCDHGQAPVPEVCRCQESGRNDQGHDQPCSDRQGISLYQLTTWVTDVERVRAEKTN